MSPSNRRDATPELLVPMTPRQGSAVALDVGTRRIGVAATDPGGELARPLEVLERRGTKRDLRALQAMTATLEFESWIVGLPPATEGADQMHRAARRFAEALMAADPRPVFLVDEAGTTALAHERLRAQGLKQARRKLVVDKVAAQIILQRWLDGAPAQRVAGDAPQPT